MNRAFLTNQNTHNFLSRELESLKSFMELDKIVSFKTEDSRVHFETLKVLIERCEILISTNNFRVTLRQEKLWLEESAENEGLDESVLDYWRSVIRTSISAFKLDSSKETLKPVLVE